MGITVRPDPEYIPSLCTLHHLSVAAFYATGSEQASSSASQKRQEGDVASGQLVFNNARRTRHTTREGDNRLGPNLYKIVGRKAGSLQNYGYSSAMKGADFIWDQLRNRAPFT
jgi:cytochrome c2